MVDAYALIPFGNFGLFPCRICVGVDGGGGYTVGFEPCPWTERMEGTVRILNKIVKYCSNSARLVVFSRLEKCTVD
jgi:hypothetical protein